MSRDHRLKNISFSQRLPIPTTFDQYEGSTSIHYVDVSRQWEQKSLGPDRFIRTEGTSSYLWVACGWVEVPKSTHLPRIDLLVLSMGVWPIVPRLIAGTPSPTPAKPIVRYFDNVLPIGEVYVGSYTRNPESRITEYGIL